MNHIISFQRLAISLQRFDVIMRCTLYALFLSSLWIVAAIGQSKNVILAQGDKGRIRVEERNGLRLLIIDGVVQGGVPSGLIASQRVIDPMVELIRAVKPEARTVLVIGLGTGKTANDLDSMGFSVDAVELEPVVIDFARRFFDYKGEVVEADGLEYLKKTKKCWDVILMDAFSGGEFPVHLVSREAFTLMKRRLSSVNGLLAIRLLSRPDDPGVQNMLQYGTMGVYHKQMFGSGIGSEKQNLYVLASTRELEIENPPVGLPLPVTTRGGELLPGRRRSLFGDRSISNNGQSRKMVVLGYLIRAKETGDICIDLPHCEMGAIRYRIQGDALPELSDLIKGNTYFPTASEISGDGDRSETFDFMLGGGRVLRSDVRFSRILVAVESNARLRSIIDPDSLLEGKDSEALLPYGGILYELEVSRVLMSLDYRSWQEFRQEKLAPIINRITCAFAANDIGTAATSIGDYLKELDARLKGFGSKCSFYIDLAKFELVLEMERKFLGERNSPFEVAVACDFAESFLYWIRNSRDVEFIKVATRECAEQNYTKVANHPDDPNAPLAASRLLYLLSREWHISGSEQKVKELQKRYKNLKPTLQVPFEKECHEELNRSIKALYEKTTK